MHGTLRNRTADWSFRITYQLDYTKVSSHIPSECARLLGVHFPQDCLEYFTPRILRQAIDEVNQLWYLVVLYLTVTPVEQLRNK